MKYGVLLITIAMVTVSCVLCLAMSQPGADGIGGRLSFEQRVNYQRELEKVFYRNREWPEGAAQSKPRFEENVSDEIIAQKVRAGLQKSMVLETLWYRPLSGEQLQAELDRTASQTYDPRLLDELFRVLNKDPYLIAECLIRPILGDRLSRKWFAYDERFHGDLKAEVLRDMDELTASSFVNNLEDKGRLVHLIKSSEVSSESDKGDGPERVDAATFGEMVSRFPDTSDEFSLDETDDYFIIRMTISRSDNEFLGAVRAYPKKSFDVWLEDQDIDPRMSQGLDRDDYTFSLPAIRSAGDEFKVDRWSLGTNGISQRYNHTAVWTGNEMIVFGGYNGDRINSVGIYYPSIDHWAGLNLSMPGLPYKRDGHTAVWTGNEMLVWGGKSSDTTYTNSGSRFNPVSLTWNAMTNSGAPAGRTGHTAIWTGVEMIVWGGNDGSSTFNDGGRYDPGLNVWQSLTTTGAPVARHHHTAVWAGTHYKMIVWGGFTGINGSNTGGRYNPSSDTWETTSLVDVPVRRGSHSAVWTGYDMIVWGGNDTLNYRNTGAVYTPSTDSWVATSTISVPSGRRNHTAVWNGSEMMIWGGSTSVSVNTGGRYNPASQTWTPITNMTAPRPRDRHTAVWTGTEMIVWGGFTGIVICGDGGRLKKHPIMTTLEGWVPIKSGDVPESNVPTTVWTGTEMIVWGGTYENSLYLNSGAMYYPVLNAWSSTSLTSAPLARSRHRAIWTGTEMIVWGGIADPGGLTNTGGRFNPSTNSWTATPTLDAPSGRSWPTVVWAPELDQMLVWGGQSLSGIINTGGKYQLDGSWTAISLTGAPSPRTYQTGCWTGTELLVWGGSPNYEDPLNSGGQYNPVSDVWRDISNLNSPLPSYYQQAVWTGSEMIVWGGAKLVGSTLVAVSGEGAYNPTTQTWRPLDSNGPPATFLHSAVWTGQKMIVWSGSAISELLCQTGGIYHPGTDSWRYTDLSTALSARVKHSAIWTGSEMIVYGGIMKKDYDQHYGFYFPNTLPYSAPDILNVDDTVTLGLGETLMLSHTLPTCWWSDDVESETQWSTTGHWQVANGYLQNCSGVNDYISATHSWYLGDPDTCTYESMTGWSELMLATPVSVKPDPETVPLFTFRYFLQTDEYFKTDAALVEGRLNGGSWTTLGTNKSNWSDDLDGVCLEDQCRSWQAVMMPLEKSFGPIPVGATLEIRFLFYSDSEIKTGMGWLIDDIGIGHPAGDGSNPTSTVPYHDKWDWATYEWDLNADGITDNPDILVPTWSISEADLGNFNLARPGTYPLSLHVVDSLGLADTNAVTLTVNDGIAPVVTLISPNGGESWAYSETEEQRKSHLIVWNSDDNFDITRSRVDYSTDAGTTWSCIVDSRSYTYPQTMSYEIPDNDPNGATIQRYVTNSFTVKDINIQITINHPRAADLQLWLSKHHGPLIKLAENTIVEGADYNQTVFDDEADVPIGEGSPPFTGYYRPEEPLSTFDGLSSLGYWQLKVIDSQPKNIGTIEQVSFNFSACGDDVLADLAFSPDDQNHNWSMPTALEASQAGQVFPSAESLVRVQVWDQSSNSATDMSDNNFYIIQPTTTAVKTLIVWHSARSSSKSGERADLGPKLLELADHTKVIGEVLDLNNAGIDYSVWDSNPTSVTAANDVAFQIRNYIRAQLETYSNVKYLILIGTDHQVPFFRMADGTSIHSETQYPAEVGLNTSNPVGAALNEGYFLTDNYYAELADENSGLAAPHNLVYLNDLALGRLVESDTQIIQVINTFLALDGQVNLIEASDKVLVTGFDFIYDSAFDIKELFSNPPYLKTTDCLLDDPDRSGTSNPCDDMPFGPDDLYTSLYSSTPHTISNVNTHANHYAFAASTAATVNDTDLCTVPAYDPTRCYSMGMDQSGIELAGTVLFTPGCHSGLSVPPSDAKPLDLPEQMAVKKVLAYIGNTGYGWGLRYGKGLSEKLMETIAARMLSSSSISIGTVLAEAKREYYLEEKRYDVFDEKVLHELTLFGIPNTIIMTNSSKTHASETTLPAPDGPDRGCVNGICLEKNVNSDRSKALPPGVTELELEFSFGSETYQLIVSPDGSYYTLNSKASCEVGESIQPQFVYDSQLSGTVAHGVIFTQGSYERETGFNPVVAVPRSTNIDYGEGPLPLVSTFTPCVRITQGTSGGSSTKDITEVGYTNMVVHTGYFDQTADQRQFRFDSMKFVVYYSNLPDMVGPVITDPAPDTFHALNGMDASFSVEVQDDLTDVFRVLITYNDSITDQWKSLDLVHNTGSGRWEGELNLKGNIIYYVGAVDLAGNVSILSDSMPDLDGRLVPYGSTWQGPRIFTIDLDLADTDNDLMPDIYENMYYCLNKNVNDAAIDYDLDGLTNFEEYVESTNPCNGDTDGSGDNDGSELNNGRDPLDGSDDKHIWIEFTKQGDDYLIEWHDGISSSPCPVGENKEFNNKIDGPYFIYRSTDKFFDYDEWLINPATPLPDGTNCHTDTTAGGTDYYYKVWNRKLDMPAPQIVLIDPNSGPTAGGTPVSIYGNYFETGAAVYFKGVLAPFTTVVSQNKINCVTPPNTAGSGQVTVVNPNGQEGTLVDGFTYQ